MCSQICTIGKLTEKIKRIVENVYFDELFFSSAIDCKWSKKLQLIFITLFYLIISSKSEFSTLQVIFHQYDHLFLSFHLRVVCDFTILIMWSITQKWDCWRITCTTSILWDVTCGGLWIRNRWRDLKVLWSAKITFEN